MIRQRPKQETTVEAIEKRNIILSRLMLNNKLISPDQLHDCVKVQIKPDNTLDLAEIAATLNLIDQGTLDKLESACDRAMGRQAESSAAGFSTAASDKENAKVLHQWLDKAMQSRASDLHVMTGYPLTVRTRRILFPYKDTILGPELTKKVLTSILTEEEKRRLYEQKSVGTCFSIEGGGRARCNIFYHSAGMNGVFRLVPATIPHLDELNIPEVVSRLTTYSQGLILITSPISGGKTTTLASLVDMINRSRQQHVITLESPIEFVHTCKKCLVTQREVGRHTESFAVALRAALREDPDVIVVGEMRDVETARLALNAAETGHLVLSTLHTEDANRSINRIIDFFPADEQNQIRSMLSENLRGIICQQLVPTVKGSSMVPIMEIMFNSPGIANLIRDRKLFQLKNMLKITSEIGNISMEDYSRALFWDGVIAEKFAKQQYA